MTTPQASDPLCPLCHGLGWRSADPTLAPPAPGFGTLVPCACNQAELARQQRARLINSGLPTRLQQQTFASFTLVDEADPPHGRGSNRLAYQAARHFADQLQGWLVLTGPTGSGKTHLLAAIANTVQATGRAFSFATAPDLLDELREGYGDLQDYAARLQRLRQSPLLLLDDLGAEAPTPWAAEKLFQLLNYRYNQALPTALATNFPLRDLPPRLRSRCQDTTLVQAVAVTVRDWRRRPVPGAQS